MRDPNHRRPCPCPNARPLPSAAPSCLRAIRATSAPRCLLRAGLGGDSQSLARNDGPDATAARASVFDSIAATIGHVPYVLLRDTAPGEGDADPSIRYRIDGEIAHGGMGAILKGHDPDLGRDVALKVLREDLCDNADMVRRGGADRRPVAAPGNRADLRAGHFHRPSSVLLDEAGQGAHARRLAGRQGGPGRRPATLSLHLRGGRPDRPTPTPAA